jgi:hypothetical protein
VAQWVGGYLETGSYFLIVVLGVHCSIYKSSYNISNISQLNCLPLHHFPLSFLPLPWNSFSRSQFSIFIHVYTMLAPYHAPIPFPNLLPLIPNPADWTCSGLLFSDFVKKKMTFLFKIATQGASLRHFYVYMHCNPSWFISSIFLLSTLVRGLFKRQLG